MTNTPFDELNQLSESKRKSKPYDEYFGEMDLSTSQRIERIDFSEDFEESILFVLSLALTMLENGEESVDKEYLKSVLISRYTEIALIYLETSKLDAYMTGYINDFSENIIAATFNNQEDSYYFSDDRAMFISEDEANTTLNYKDYKKAVLSGKKNKTWVDIGDNRERKTHLAVGGRTIPIKEDFLVGGYPMKYPKDTSRAPGKEYINCRCSIKYS